MKKFNKGMVITSTVAAALAALTFAGCGSTAIGTASKTAPEANAAQAVKNDEAAVPAAAVKAENTAEKTAETTTAAKKNSKKTADKKKKSKKTSKKNAETAQQIVQPTVIIPAVQVQPAQTQKAAETPANTQAPAAVIPEDVYPVWVEGDIYAGTYVEETAGRGVMEITRNSDGTYSVEVNWPSSAFEKNSWNFTGEFNGRGAMNYTNCRKTTSAFDANGNYTYDSDGLMTPYTTYSMGSGSIEFKTEGVLEWKDDMGDILPGTRFVSCKAYDAKANEIGTAGSCYYDNENTKANEEGTAGSNYYANEWDAVGSFYDVNGNRVSLEVVKSDIFENTYDCTVRMSSSAFDSVVYGFSAKLVNDTLVYDRGAKSFLSFDSNGSIAENYIIDKGHSGTISYTGAAGLRWNDSDGSNYVFMGSAFNA